MGQRFWMPSILSHIQTFVMYMHAHVYMDLSSLSLVQIITIGDPIDGLKYISPNRNIDNDFLIWNFENHKYNVRSGHN